MTRRATPRGLSRFSPKRKWDCPPLSPNHRRGFSLLEVILALAILAGALAVLGEITRQSLRNADYARDVTRAELLCESKLAEILTGASTTDPVQNAVLETDEDNRNWLYSVSTEAVDDLGLLAVTVSVTYDSSSGTPPPAAAITRWMIDPNMTLSAGTSSGSSTSGTGTTSTSGGTQ